MDKTLKLQTPIKGPRGMIDELRIRAPKFNDYAELGDPRVPVPAGEGYIMWRQVPSAVKDYIERLVDIDPNLLPQLTLPDTLALFDTVTSFFQPGADDTSTSSSDAPQTSSSSPEDTGSAQSTT